MPLIVVSPWARAGYVSRVVQDHTSVLAFIERKWNLPAMTLRDANAHPMTDYFNFRRAAFAKPPKLAPAPKLGPGLARCHAAGLNPPLSGGGVGSRPPPLSSLGPSPRDVLRPDPAPAARKCRVASSPLE